MHVGGSKLPCTTITNSLLFNSFLQIQPATEHGPSKMVGQEESEGGFHAERRGTESGGYRGPQIDTGLTEGQINKQDFKMIEHYLVDTCKR